jgi:hypothetical protein
MKNLTQPKEESELKKMRLKCRKKFLYYFPNGFYDKKYIEWERDYKWQAHLKYEEVLNEKEFKKLLSEKEYNEIARRAVNIETKTNLLFSFEKMALRDAVKSYHGAKLFAEGLFKYIYGKTNIKERFKKFAETLSILPRKQTRVRTWPLQTVFGFIARPKEFIFLKPRVTQAAAEAYGYTEFEYGSAPDWNTYRSFLRFAAQIKKDISDLRPRDMIDIQSFIWVLGSSEYE